ncbi:MAG: asparagine synthase-related protein [Sphingomicrobium sp.]
MQRHHGWQSPLAVEAATERHWLCGQLRLENSEEFRRDANDASTPAELVLREFEQVGDAAFAQIEGEFALAILRFDNASLTLTRDALGRLPLFMAIQPDFIHFGDHAATVARLAGRPSVDIDKLAAFLLQRGGEGERSFFVGVEPIPPGVAVSVPADGSSRGSCWWRPDLSPTPLTDEGLLEALGAELRRSIGAIQAHGHPIAAHLTAGLDSSLTAATISAGLSPGSRLNALCASPAAPVTGPPGQAIGDEFPLASETAARLGNVDLERVVARENWITVSDRFSKAAGMPYPNQANLGWLAATYERARGMGAAILIDSTQGNTTTSWQGHGAVPTLLKQFRLAELLRVIRDGRRRLGGTGLMVVPRALFALLPARIADGLAMIRGIPDAAEQRMLRRRHPAIRRVLAARQRDGHTTRAYRPPVGLKQRLELIHWGDVASHNAAMARLYGVQTCDPFAARRLIELTLRIEDPRFIADGYGRRFAREMLRGRVPDDVASGQINWQQGVDWRQDALATQGVILADLDYAARQPVLAELLDIERLKREVGYWSEGSDDVVAMAHGGTVMRAVAAIRFYRWVERGAPEEGDDDQPLTAP